LSVVSLFADYLQGEVIVVLHGFLLTIAKPSNDIGVADDANVRFIVGLAVIPNQVTYFILSH
tara:strand:- start:335 stop:520 length:186 start_codon:yes stop_codon:yes gene_type:complete